MFIKLLCLVIVTQIIYTHQYEDGGQNYYMIKNMKTGMVLDGKSTIVKMAPWSQKACQTWTIYKSNIRRYYFIRNVDTGKVLTANRKTKQIFTMDRRGLANQKWCLDKRLHIPPPFVFMTQIGVRDVKAMPSKKPRNDGRDQFKLVKIFPQEIVDYED